MQRELIGQELENNWLECKEKQRAEHGGIDKELKRFESEGFKTMWESCYFEPDRSAA